MATKTQIVFDPATGMGWLPAIVVVLTFLVFTVNSVGQYFVLTTVQAAFVGFLATVLAGLVTLFTTMEVPVVD